MTVSKDRGAASILVVVTGLVVVAAGLVVAVAAAHLTGEARAQAAADQAALAGASWAYAGESVACARAAVFAEKNDATLVSCSLNGLDLYVTVEIDGARSTAHAGPVGMPGSGEGG
jgi:secretion/DNA translocation related TadE-like protein